MESSPSKYSLLISKPTTEKKYDHQTIIYPMLDTIYKIMVELIPKFNFK